MRHFVKAIIFASTIGAAVGVAGCAEEQGPLEKAGESMDEAAEEVGDEIDDAT